MFPVVVWLTGWFFFLLLTLYLFNAAIYKN
jgi:hypothetical protein